MDHIDIIYYINLHHRTDRKEHLLNELNKMNIPIEKIHRIEAVEIKNKGYLGCSKSHILALETFLQSSHENQNCLILEDDFTFRDNKETTQSKINEFFQSIEAQIYDVFMFACCIYNKENASYPSLCRIIQGTTTSGYCITRKYAPTLISNIQESVDMLEKLGYRDYDYHCDQYMDKIQKTDHWYTTIPSIGFQYSSFSDVDLKYKERIF